MTVAGRTLLRWLFVLLVTAQTALPALGGERFIINDIRIEGLRRIAPGTVFNYLPVKVGDEFDENRSGEAIRALFKTGFFKDVRIERTGDTLVVVVSERETISQIGISGNNDIKTEDLFNALKQIGFAEGEVFDRSLLDKVEQELRRQYFGQGKYAVQIESNVKSMGSNRVAVTIQIAEGRAARIKQINVVGNKAYDDDELLKSFKLTTPTLISFFTKSDQYSKQKLGADLEALRSHYLDSGFVNFNIDSTQVSITPDKSDVYVTINVSEGERYEISDVKLAGDLIVPADDLFPLVTTGRGEIFSRKEVTQTSTNISERLGDEGYAFANVNPVPQIDEKSKTVSLTYFVDPGKRVYVRRINFSGNAKTRDEVLRREMRQMEGAWFSTGKVNRSKTRLQKLGYFEEVNVETPAVPETPDQVDVNYSVVERASGNLLLGLGFSQTQGLIFNTSVVQDNFLGSGKRVNFAFNNSDVNRVFALGYIDPYFTIDGISQGFDVSYRETDAGDANITRFDSKVASAGVNFGIPVSEFNFLNLGFNYENTEISQDERFTSDVVRDFIERHGKKFDVLQISSGFAYDTRNKALLPDRGTYHRVRGQVAVPGGDLQYYKIDYDGRWFYPFTEDYVLALQGQLGYGDGYGETEVLPFFENFYAGGPRTVRGYEENTLGPEDEDNRALGGNVMIVANAELILPVPFLTDVESVRITAFVDAGNVYGEDEDIDLDTIRLSAGLSGLWVSPFGVLTVSVAQPFNDSDTDDTQPFQFTFGTSF
ncbi:MAG: Outer membrane protein assembly factor BamA [Chromatiales bacterium USCg_Taylor]|nr:MAG: Outer membrane protein assembly factor BamA [Chromatiales bacterium USCg_Taylor]